MPSIIQGFEYDIFISYRHKDNLPSQGFGRQANNDGWVTEFVQNLKKELEATFKEDISIYFDENPHDGLLETHDVDDSLKEKLKCLIFIPIISQTYCDPKSFAWRNELLVFLKMAGEDSIGLKVRLPNGNTASRVLPIRIHELDVRDKKLIEAELGPLRAIDFTYQSAGVNRPLRPKDDESAKGQSQNVYRDQINKTANAIKDIIAGLQGGAESPAIVTASDENKVPVNSSRQVRSKRSWNFKMPEAKTIGFSLVILILSVALIYIGTNKNINDKQGLPIKTSITLPDSIQMTFMAGPLGTGRRALEISPDGKTIVFVSMDAHGKSHLNLRPIDQYNITMLPKTEGAFAPFFSPDSKWIAFFSNDKLMKISVNGGLIETLSQSANPIDGIWGEDDRITWIGNEGAVLNSIQSNGKDFKTIQYSYRIGSRPTNFSPGEFIVSNYLNEIRWVSFTNGEDKLILKGAQNPVLHNDNLLFVRGTDLLSIGFDSDKLITVGNPLLLEKSIGVDGYENAQVSISKNGTLIFATGTHNLMGSLSWRNISGEIELLPFEAQLFGNFSISPDGKKVAATLRNEQYEIRLYDFSEKGNSFLFAKEEFSQNPEWSADGAWIFYTTNQNGKAVILRKLADGRSEVQVVLGNDSLDAQWDVNGKGWILYQSFEAKRGFVDLNLFSPEKQAQNLFFKSRPGVVEALASFIKDDWIGFSSDQTGRFEVFISDLLNSEVRTQVSFDGGEEPLYDSASRTLYWRNGNKLMAVSLTFGDDRSFKIGSSRIVFDDENWVNVPGYSYDISPDGKRFLIVRSQRNKSTNEIKISQNF